MPSVEHDTSIFAGLLSDLPPEPQDSPDHDADITHAHVVIGEATFAPPEEAIPVAAPLAVVDATEATGAETAQVEAGATAAEDATAEDLAPAVAQPAIDPAPPAPLALLGPGMMARLKLLGFDSFEDLACVDPAALRHALGDISRLLNVEAWVVEARRQVAARHGAGLG